MGAKFQKEIAKRIGEKIRKCRIEEALRQEDLAEKIGVGPSQISKWETGIQIPRADKFLELNSVLNFIPQILAEWEKSYRPELLQPQPEQDFVVTHQEIRQLQKELALLRKKIATLKSHP